MSPINNFHSSNIRRTPYTPALNTSLLSHNSAGHSVSTAALMDVFSTPVQHSHISKLSSLQPSLNAISPSKLKNESSINFSSKPKLDPGFVSSSDSRGMARASSTSLNSHLNYTPTHNKISMVNNRLNTKLDNQNTIHITNSDNNPENYHSRYFGDVTDNHQSETFDQSNYMLNTPEKALLSLPNSIQLQHSYLPQVKPINQYLNFETVPSTINSHVHSLSLDTITSSHSHKSLANDTWFSTYNHRHTLSNTSPISTPPGDDSSIMEIAREHAESSIEDLVSQIKETEKILSLSNEKNPKENRNFKNQKKKHQQLFALVSLIKTVRISENAVCPRNIVYSKYVAMCKKFGLTPVCNAAFGKFVKVFYPEIKTRRLGIRGSSRYNYCGIELIDEKPSDLDKYDNVLNFSSKENNILNDVVDEDKDKNKDEEEKLSNKNIHHVEKLPNKLAFEKTLFTSLDSSIEFVPDFYENIDVNLKDSHKIILDNYCDYLLQLYHYWRYLKVESLFKEIDEFTFQKNLSPEYFTVYKMEYKELAPLIASCDLEIYKSSAKLVSKIIFQYVPENVYIALCDFENCFIDHIKNMKVKPYIIEEKMGYALQFKSIISVLRKVVSLSSSVSKLLCKRDNLETFYKEWKEMNTHQIIENHFLIPDDMKPQIIRIFTQYLGNVFQSLGLRDDSTWEDDSIICRDLIIRKLSLSFATIPLEFPNVEPAVLLLYFDSIGSTILRELTLESMTSNFSIWWTLISWSNEYMSLMAMLGGFLG